MRVTRVTGEPIEGGGHEHHLWDVAKVRALATLNRRLDARPDSEWGFDGPTERARIVRGTRRVPTYRSTG